MSSSKKHGLILPALNAGLASAILWPCGAAGCGGRRSLAGKLFFGLLALLSWACSSFLPLSTASSCFAEYGKEAWFSLTLAPFTLRPSLRSHIDLIPVVVSPVTTNWSSTSNESLYPRNKVTSMLFVVSGKLRLEAVVLDA